MIVTQINFTNPTLFSCSNFYWERFLTSVLFVSSPLLVSLSFSSSNCYSLSSSSSPITPSSSETTTTTTTTVVVVRLSIVVIVVLIILSSTSSIITNDSLSSETKYDSGYSSYCSDFNIVSYFSSICDIIAIINITCGAVLSEPDIS